MALFGIEIQVFYSLTNSLYALDTILECKLCQGTNHKLLFFAEDHYSGDRFALVMCCNCKLIFTNPRPSSDVLSKYYPPSYYGANGKRFHPILEHVVQYFRKQLADRISSRYPNGGRILEVGSGRGTLLSEMSRKGWSAVGTEYSASLAKSTGDSFGVFVYPTPDLRDCNFPDRYFDVVVCNHVLEHLTDPIGTLIEIRRILNPIGLLIIAVPNIGGIVARVSKDQWFGVDVPRHLFHFSPDTLKMALTLTGFQVNSQTTLSFEQDIFGFAQSILNLTGLPYNIFYDFIRLPSAKLRHRFADRGQMTRILWYIVILIIGGALSIVGLLIVPIVSWIGKGGTIEYWASPTPAVPQDLI